MPCDTKGSVCLHTFKFQILNEIHKVTDQKKIFQMWLRNEQFLWSLLKERWTSITDPKDISLFDDQEFISDQNQFELKENVESIKLIKSKERVQNHVEVFTPKWMVQKMLAEPAIQAKL